MDVPHRFLPPANVMWLGLVPQLLPRKGGGGGVKRWEEGCWWVRGWMEKIMNACISTAYVHLMFFIMDCSLFSFHHWNIQELEGFWLKSQLRIQNSWASRRGVGTLSECTVLRCPWARYRTPKCYPGHLIHSDTSPTMIAWVLWG